MNLAKSSRSKPTVAAGYYLDAARAAAQTLTDTSNPVRTDAMEVYNQASSDLTQLLRETPDLWNHTETIQSPLFAYHLHFAPASRASGIWDPGFFDFFRTRDQVKNTKFKHENERKGLGGVLVGVNKPNDPRKYFYPKVGVAAPVTVSLNFAETGNKAQKDVTLVLNDPTLRDTARVDGKNYPLSQDFTAPLAYYPNPKFLWLATALRPDRYIKAAGIYMIQPYDPNRIPVLFVHGLISYPQMWLPTLNAIESDPVLRGKFQFWVFGYPSGNPIAFSAMQLRENLKGIYSTYPKTKDMVVVSHSMGGLLTQMQVVNTGRTVWNGVFKKNADLTYKAVPTDSVLKKTLIFEANPHIKNVVFICTPHRGANMASGTIGAAGMWLIKLPGNVVKNVFGGIGTGITAIPGFKKNIKPTGILGLSPQSPVLHSLNTLPIQVPFYSIIGNQGKPGPLKESSDSVVEYWSSHLDRAKGEAIVPYPHGCCELPQTISEVKKILHTYLKN